MRDCWRIEILRLGTAALIRIFTRMLTCLGQWRCRNGRCLSSRLARSSRWASSKPVPRGSFQTFHHVSTSLLCFWNSLHCPRGVHSCVRREKMFIGFGGLAKPSCKQYTSHVTFFSCLCALVMMCHTTLAQVFVHVISSMCHAPECLISLQPSLRTLHLSLPSSTSSS